MQNIGHLYYKKYFENITFELVDNETNVKNLGFDVNTLFNLPFPNTIKAPEVIENNEDKFELITTYPGLLIGSGYNHEVGGKELEGELKLGFFFDHTTGLPCIPGSSVKGVLRDACVKAEGNYILSIIKELAGVEEDKRETTDELKKLANEFLKENENSLLRNEIVNEKGEKVKEKYSKFVDAVFNGRVNDKSLPNNKRDIFHDAFPVASFNEKRKFLGNDYITHHPDPLKNPNPVQFLKILPLVMFRFDFRLTDNVMTKKLKLELFRQILLDLGIGAKTNVGYGQFAIISKDIEEKNNQIQYEQNMAQHRSEFVQKIPNGVKLEKTTYNAVVSAKGKVYYNFTFTVDDNKIILSKRIQAVEKKLRGISLNVNQAVKIRMNAEYPHSGERPNFTVLLSNN